MSGRVKVVNLSGPARRKRAKPKAPKPKVALVTLPAANPRRRPRRRNRNRNRGSQGGGGSTSVTLSFLIDSFIGSANGTVKFGPKLEQSAAMKGLLQAYQKYRITSLSLKYVTEASSTDRGCVSFHVDTSCKMLPTSLKPTTSWPLHLSGGASFSRKVLGDKDWYESSEEQFWFLYKGSGENFTAGHIVCTMRVTLTNPL